MERIRRCKTFIIATIACAVLLCAAGFSVSLAAWTGGGGSPTAEASGTVGQFYVEYPRYATAQGDTVVQAPNLVANQHYLQVPRRDNNKISDYYLMSEETSQYNYQEKVVRNVYLQEGDTFNMYFGTSKTTIGDISGEITSNTVQKEGYYSFYFKHNDNNALHVGYTPMPSEGDGSTGTEIPPERDTSKNSVLVEFSDGAVVFQMENDTNFGNTNLHIWKSSSAGTIWPGLAMNKLGTNIDNNNYIKLGFSCSETVGVIISEVGKNTQTDASQQIKTSDDFFKDYLPLQPNCTYTITPTLSGFTHWDNLTNNTPAQRDTKFTISKSDPNTSGSGGTTTQVTPAEPAVHGATEFTVGDDGEIQDYPLMEVRHAKMTGNPTEAGTYLYKNYVCVSRQNSSLTTADNSIAFVEFNILNADGTTKFTPRYTFDNNGTKTQNSAWDKAYDPKVKRITIKRADTDSDGNPNGGEITPAPRLYNYYPEEETHLSEISHGGQYGTTDTTNHMVPHYNDGMYCILFFAQEKQQYFALDIEIELETDGATGFDFEQGFTLKADANNINSWQRFEQGYGQQWGFYMGGLVNNVWLWDPRRTTQMKGTTLNGETDVQELSYDNVKVKYPKNEINLSLTVNLTAGSLVKPYMLDMTGYRMQENGKEPTAATAYLLPKKITAPADLYLIDPDDASKGEYTRYNTDSTIDNKTNINLRIPKSGEYTFVLKGEVSTRFASGTSGDIWWVNLVDGTTQTSSTDPGDDWESVSHYNFMVDELIITTSSYANNYTVTFDSKGGSAVASQVVKLGGKAQIPDEPAKDNANFVGWYTDEACTIAYDFNTLVSADITLYAKWASANDTGVYVNGVLKGALTKDGTKYTATNIPLKAGEEIEFWYDHVRITDYAYIRNGKMTGGGSTHVDTGVSPALGDMVGGLTSANVLDTTIPVKATKDDIYTFYYETSSGNTDRGIWACYGGTLNTSTDGVYDAAGANRKAAFAAGTGNLVVANGVKLDAQTAELTVKFNDYTRTVKGLSLAAGKYNITYDFVANNVTATSVGYNVTLNANGGTLAGVGVVTTNATTKKLSTLPTAPTKPADDTGKSFDGWYTAASGGEKITVDTTFSDDTTIYAQWFITVSFDTDGGAPLVAAKTKVKTGSAIGALVGTVSKLGYSFNGWKYEGSEAWSSSTVVEQTSSFTLKADWLLNTYNLNYPVSDTQGSNPSTYKVTDGTNGTVSLETPTAPSGYKFVNWTVGQGGSVIANNEITPSLVEGLDNGDTINIYANFVPDTVTVRFDANGGSCTTASDTVNDSGKLTSLPTPTRANYAFTGWYTAASGGEEVTTNTTFSVDTTIYAQWTNTYYTVNGKNPTKLVAVDKSSSDPSNLTVKYIIEELSLNKNNTVEIYQNGTRLSMNVEASSRGIDISTAGTSSSVTQAYAINAGNYYIELKQYSDQVASNRINIYATDGTTLPNNSLMVQFSTGTSAKLIVFVFEDGASGTDYNLNLWARSGTLTAGGGYTKLSADGTANTLYCNSTNVNVQIRATYGTNQNWGDAHDGSQLTDGRVYTIRWIGWTGSGSNFSSSLVDSGSRTVNN